MISRQLNDLIGLGECLRHIKELILGLLQTYVTNEDRKIEREVKRLQAQTLAIQNAGLILVLCAEHGCSPAEILLLAGPTVSTRIAFQTQEQQPLGMILMNQARLPKKS